MGWRDGGMEGASWRDRGMDVLDAPAKAPKYDPTALTALLPLGRSGSHVCVPFHMPVPACPTPESSARPSRHDPAAPPPMMVGGTAGREPVAFCRPLERARGWVWPSLAPSRRRRDSRGSCEPSLGFPVLCRFCWSSVQAFRDPPPPHWLVVTRTLKREASYT